MREEGLKAEGGMLVVGAVIPMHLYKDKRIEDTKAKLVRVYVHSS